MPKILFRILNKRLNFLYFFSQLCTLKEVARNTLLCLFRLSRNTSFDSLLKLKVSCLSNIPQFLLVLPLLKLAENTTTDINNTDTNSPPFVSDWKRLQSKLIKNEKHQR